MSPPLREFTSADEKSIQELSSFPVERMVLAAGMAAIALITGGNVLSRYVLNISLGFTEGFTVLFMVIISMVGAATAFARDRHIVVDYFVGKLPASARSLMELLSYFGVLLCFSMIVIYGFILTYDDYLFETMLSSIEMKQWLFTIWLPISSLLVIYRVVQKIVRWRGR